LLFFFNTNAFLFIENAMPLATVALPFNIHQLNFVPVIRGMVHGLQDRHFQTVLVNN
jgi:hypothetical protein